MIAALVLLFVGSLRVAARGGDLVIHVYSGTPCLPVPAASISLDNRRWTTTNNLGIARFSRVGSGVHVIEAAATGGTKSIRISMGRNESRYVPIDIAANRGQ